MLICIMTLVCCHAGCTGTICGVSLSQQLEDFLNFPNLNLLLCGLLADCTNIAYTDGTVGEVSEQLTITLAKPTASSDALIAAGDSTVCPSLLRSYASWYCIYVSVCVHVPAARWMPVAEILSLILNDPGSDPVSDGAHALAGSSGITSVA